MIFIFFKSLHCVIEIVSCIHSNILGRGFGYNPQKSLTPYITGTPLPIGGSFQNVMTDSIGISYAELQKPTVIKINFPPGIIGRIFEVGIESGNVHRVRVQLFEVPNGLLYTLTSPQYNRTDLKCPNPRLTGFPPVYSSGLQVHLLDTIDGRPPRHVKIFTDGCFYQSSVQYLVTSTHKPIITTTAKPPQTTSKYAEYNSILGVGFDFS